jgi:hypothetical protein
MEYTCCVCSKVFVFSSMHVTGEQLDQYTGIAATLRFPLSSELPGSEDAAGAGGDSSDDEHADGLKTNNEYAEDYSNFIEN